MLALFLLIDRSVKGPRQNGKGELAVGTDPMASFVSHSTRLTTLHVDNSLPVGHSRAMAKPALGRGLGALLSGSPTAAKAPLAPVLATPQTTGSPVVDAREGVERVPLARIRPCPLQR